MAKEKPAKGVQGVKKCQAGNVIGSTACKKAAKKNSACRGCSNRK